MFKKGFSLAEILITLGVIGVVSAITLPTLIKNYQKHVTVNRLKTVYSTLSQAILMAEKDYDVFENWDLAKNSDIYNGGKTFFETYLKPYISSVTVFQKGNSYVDEVFGANRFAFSTKNGTVVAILHAYDRTIFLHVDINGMKGPNERGKDIFDLLMIDAGGSDTSGSPWWGVRNKGGLYFWGSGLDRNYLLKNTAHCDCSGLSGNSGSCYKRFCGALIQQDGWKIKDDYPW